MQTRSSISPKLKRHLFLTASLAFAASLAGLFGSAFAADDTAGNDQVLRVCASAHEAPYSTDKGDGFENKIAEILGKAMDRKVEFVWSEKPAIYLVRDQLDVGNCDVVMGLDTGDDRVLTTAPYYRAPYVFVERTDSPLDITSFDSPDLLKAGKIGYIPGSPAETMITKLNLFGANFNYVKSLSNFKSPRNQYVRIDPDRLVSEVANGNADLVIAFSPEVARFVKERGDKLKMVVVPDNNTRVDGEKVPFHFDQSLGVRKDDAALRDELNAAITKAKPEIQAVLKDEGIPLQQASNPSGSKS
jgi:mxaJ protein